MGQDPGTPGDTAEPDAPGSYLQGGDAAVGSATRIASSGWEAATELSGSLAVEGRAGGAVGIMASGEALRGCPQRQG